METHLKSWTVFPLTLNFRSDETICNAANRLMDGESPMKSVSGRPGMTAIRRSLTGEREVVEVADEIQKVSGGHSSIAVLLRTNALVQQWARGLTEMGIRLFARPPSVPSDWEKTLTFLSLCCEPDNDWLAYRAIKMFNANPAKAEQVRAQALKELKSINQIGLNFARNMSLSDAVTKLASVASAESMRFIGAIISQSSPEITLLELLNEAQRANFPTPACAEGVTVTTIHSYKGMEADIVICPAFEEGIIPVKSNEAEDLRLAYVAFTRARRVLIISHAERRRNQFTGKMEDQQPSRFLTKL